MTEHAKDVVNQNVPLQKVNLRQKSVQSRSPQKNTGFTRNLFDPKGRRTTSAQLHIIHRFSKRDDVEVTRALQFPLPAVLSIPELKIFTNIGELLDITDLSPLS